MAMVMALHVSLRGFFFGAMIVLMSHHQSHAFQRHPASSLVVGSTPSLLRYTSRYRHDPSSWSMLPKATSALLTTTKEASSSTLMLDIDDEDEEGIGAWVPIGSISSLSGLGPQQIMVMGINMVVWETGGSDDGDKSQWSVMADICPHRLAPLSQGRVDPETGCLECPYHGWQFEHESGVVTRIPQLDPNKTLGYGSFKATAFPTHLAGDLLFAFLPSRIHGEMFPKSLLPEEMFPTLKADMDNNATYYVRDLPYSWDFLVENFMDPAHIPFAHNSLQSLRSDGIPIPMKSVASNFTHVETTFEDQSRGKRRDGVASFQRPTMYHYREKSSTTGLYETQLNIHCVPVKAGRSRVMYTTNFFTQLPTFLRHMASNRFLNTDAWLHDAERTARAISTNDLRYVLASDSDRGVQAFRKWWNKQGLKNAPPNTFRASTLEELDLVTRGEYLDPWEWHAKHCSICRRALQRIKQVEMGGIVLTILSTIFVARRNRWLAFVGSLLGLWIKRKARQFGSAIEGNNYRSEIADRSPAHQEDYGRMNLYRSGRGNK